ncbi:TPA: hypothetical protein N0F65_003476, partial [Lagenidium giganteum]
MRSPQLYKQMAYACSGLKRIYERPSLVITFEEGVMMLQTAGAKQDVFEDINVQNKRLLRKLVRTNYIIDKFPLAVRPFYTMPDPKENRWSNSYDVMIRGEEIASGSQPVHDPKLLKERLQLMSIPQTALEPYVEAFKFGVLPHGACGIGLERVVMSFFGL